MKDKMNQKCQDFWTWKTTLLNRMMPCLMKLKKILRIFLVVSQQIKKSRNFCLILIKMFNLAKQAFLDSKFLRMPIHSKKLVKKWMKANKS